MTYRVSESKGGAGFLPSTVEPENGWLEDELVSFWLSAYFQRLLLLVLGGFSFFILQTA